MEVSFEKLNLNENNLFYFHEFIQPRFTSPFHLHDVYELILIIKSHGKLYVGSNVTNFRDNELYFFAPGLPHCFFNSRGYEKGREPAHAIVIQFKKDFLGNDFLEKAEVSQLKRLLIKSEFGLQFLNLGKPTGIRVRELIQKKNLEQLAALILLLSDLSTKKNIKLLSKNNTLNFSKFNDSKIINNVYKYVAENFQKEINSNTAASVATMQRSAFCRYFKRKTKKKFTEFVNETRIMHACKLLSETDKTIVDVSFDCGYANTSYFNRQFKLYCEVSPKTFREQFKQK
jgi:AraC-like DNA-binding protein